MKIDWEALTIQEVNKLLENLSIGLEKKGQEMDFCKHLKFNEQGNI